MESLVANYASSDEEEEQQQRRAPKSSLSSLPPPKSQQSRRIVQFKPPISLLTNGDIEDDEEEEEKQRERKRRRESQSHAVPSGKSVLSMIPAPKNSLSLGSSSSTARRVSVPKEPSPPKLFFAPPPLPPNILEDLEPSSVNAYSGYVGIEEMGREMGRRGGKAKIVQVKQDELMKNRPTPAPTSFGPAFPAVSAKGKPTKLHKRKHQIGSLYFDMRQKESELAERRSKGFLTKAETQAKYGW